MLGFYGNLKLRDKFMLPIMVLAVICIVALMWIVNSNFSNSMKIETENAIKNEVQSVSSDIERMGKKALFSATIISKLGIVTNAYEQYYKTGNLQASSKILEKEFSGKTKAKIHFHLPPARSFMRCWTDKRGDDLSSFRKTILNISKNQKPLHGIEVGRGGFVVRGLAPIFSKGKYMGDVEVLLPISNLINVSKSGEDEDFAIFMHNNLLKIATKFAKSVESDETGKIGDYTFVSQTSDKFRRDLLDESMFENIKDDVNIIKKENYIYAVFPVKDFAGDRVGVGVCQMNIKEMQNAVKKSNTKSIAIGFIILIASAGFIFVIANVVVGPLKKVISSVVALGKGDLTTKSNIRTKDEIGEIAEAVDNSIDSLGALVGNIKKNSSLLSGASEKQSAVTTQMATATEEMSSQSSTIALSAEQASSNMDDVASSIGSMNSSVSMVATSIEEMSSTINEISKNCQKESEIAESANQKAKTTNGQMKKLEISANEIGKVLDVIKDIADQTNLLALNATIEAASAGDAGKGFAVVANEVKELAKQTAQATDEIGKQIEDMRSNTNSSVKAIEDITTIIEEVNTISQTIVSAVEEQSATINEISKNINGVSATSNEVSLSVQDSASGIKEISSNISGFSEAIGEITGGMSQVEGSTSELSVMSEELEESVGRFKV